MTSYCDKDYFAQRRSSKTKAYTDWDDYADSEDFPDETSLDLVLQAATDIMNNRWHINTSSNITNSQDTGTLKDICYKMATRMLGIESGRGTGIVNFSPGDYLNVNERETLKAIGRVATKRKVGKVVF